jgi:alkanesulfonate monooxygenase SsuD/methylene tetrahydromethanopterin reductase-like flavin-dependent oxidoreductase (luciferase family)
MREEYEQSGIRFDNASVRMARLEEVVIVLKDLFADGPFRDTGDHVTVNELVGTPRPLQQPHPPILIGGGGRKLLGVAARQADIVQIMPSIPQGALSANPYDFTAEAYQEKVSWVRDAAEGRFDEIELGAQLLHVAITDDPEGAYEQFMEHFVPRMQAMGGEFTLSKDAFLASTVVAIGTLDEVCAKLEETCARFGISYWTTAVGSRPAVLAPIIERLADR